MKKEFGASALESAVDRVYTSMSSELPTVCYDIAEHLEPYCDSPIELMLGTCLLLISRLQCQAERGVYNTFVKLISPTEKIGNDAVIYLSPQFKWEGYKIDFAIRQKLSPTIVFIECDGHEFHERTPDQAEHDRSKDRKIQEAGIPILRFTGREIYRSPQSCTLNIINFLKCRIEEAQ